MSHTVQELQGCIFGPTFWRHAQDLTLIIEKNNEMALDANLLYGEGKFSVLYKAFLLGEATKTKKKQKKESP